MALRHAKTIPTLLMSGWLYGREARSRWTSKESFCPWQNEANHVTHSVFRHFGLIADG